MVMADVDASKGRLESREPRIARRTRAIWCFSGTGSPSAGKSHRGFEVYSFFAPSLSIATAARMTKPLMTCCQNGETSSSTRPLFSTPDQWIGSADRIKV